MLYLFISLPMAAFMFLFASKLPGTGPGLSIGAMIAMPVLYALFGFLFALAGAWLYNVAASMVGGFEFTTAEVAPD
jgi:hypothetical protein